MIYFFRYHLKYPHAYSLKEKCRQFITWIEIGLTLPYRLSHYKSDRKFIRDNETKFRKYLKVLYDRKTKQ